jgi:hypothetical protein
MTQPPDPFAPPSLPPSGATPPPAQQGWGPPPAQPAWGGQQPYGQWPAQPPWGAPTKTNVCAVLSLVFSFFCFPAAIVLGIVALVQLRRSQDTGRGLAIAGLVVSALWVVFGGLIVALALAGALDGYGVTTGTVSEATTTTVGECMRTSHDSSPNAVVSCSGAHDQEVYFVGPVGSGSFPGKAEVYDAADRICRDEFGAYVGASYDDSEHDYDFYVPDAREWETAEERRVVCVITPLFKTDTGSSYHSGE